MTIQNLFPLGDEPLEKTRHLFREKSRVKVIDGPHKGHTGRLLVINTRQEHVVRLDNGHEVAYRQWELEPEGFDGGFSGSEKAFALFDDDEILKKAEDAMAQRGTVTLAEANRSRLEAVQREIDRQKVEDRLSDPFGFLQEDSLNTDLLLTKRAEKDVQDDLQPIRRQLRPEEDYQFSRGDYVRDKRTGRKGKITRLDYGFADLDHGGVCICDDLEHCAVPR